MRRLFLALTLALLPGLGRATPQEVHDATLALDADRLETLFAEAHAATLEGEMTIDALYAMQDVLRASPGGKTWEVVDLWLEAHPDSPYARISRGYQLAKAAAVARGDDLAYNTAPAALRLFHDYMEEAARMAGAVWQEHPDYPLAGLLVLHTGHVAPRLTDADADHLLARLMELAPGRTLIHAGAFLALPQWGGSGPQRIAGLCDAHAEQVQATLPVAYTEIDCRADALISAPFPRESQAKALSRLGPEIPDWLDSMEGAAHYFLIDQVSAESARRLLEREVPRSLEDLRLAEMYEMEIVGGGLADPIYRRSFDAAQDWAEARIAIAPADLDAIRLLGAEPQQFQGSWPQAANAPRQRELLGNAVAVAPFDAEGWADLGLSMRDPDPLALPGVPALQNAIVYSGHDPEYILHLMTYLAFPVAIGRDAERPDLTEETALAAVACPMVRAGRLLEYACTLPQNGDTCGMIFLRPGNAVLAPIEYALENGYCPAEQQSDVFDLLYELQEVALPVAGN